MHFRNGNCCIMYMEELGLFFYAISALLLLPWEEHVSYLYNHCAFSAWFVLPFFSRTCIRIGKFHLQHSMHLLKSVPMCSYYF